MLLSERLGVLLGGTQADVAFGLVYLDGGSMKRRIAALSCCLALVHGSVGAAEDIRETRSALVTAAVVDAAPQVGPLQRASLSKDTHTMRRAETRQADRPSQNVGRDRGSWIERHPVWTGAMVGFGAGFLLTYAATHDNGRELITVMSPGAGATFWGGVSAGIGAVAGWGIGRNRDTPSDGSDPTTDRP